jgi:hypothetical protein
MAKITFNTAPQQGNTAQEHVSEQAKAAVTAYRAMLDAFVNNPTRRTALESEQVEPRQAKIAMPL